MDLYPARGLAASGALFGLHGLGRPSRYFLGMTGPVVRVGHLDGRPAPDHRAQIPGGDGSMDGLLRSLWCRRLFDFIVFPGECGEQPFVLRWTGFPIQLARGSIACAATFCLWFFAERLSISASGEKQGFLQSAFRYGVLGALALLLAGGWALTETVDRVEKFQLLKLCREQSAIVVAGLDSAVTQALAAGPRDRAAPPCARSSSASGPSWPPAQTTAAFLSSGSRAGVSFTSWMWSPRTNPKWRRPPGSGIRCAN